MAFWLVGPIALKLTVAGLSACGLSVSATPWLCFAAGLVACFAAPVLVTAALERCGKAAVIIYPARYLAPPPAIIVKKGVS